MSAATGKLEIRDVHMAFGAKKVLRGASLTVPQGKSLVIIGGSGTGKSVLLKCILGLLCPDQGSILIDGIESVHAGAQSRDIFMRKFGMLFQGAALFDSLKVWENISFGLVHGHHMSKVKAREIALEKLSDVGLKPEVAELYPAELSGGMQKRVALARAVAAHPEIIFFDEPTTGLDPIMADVIDNLIVKCVKQLGATALSITHDMNSARKIADHIAMIHEGRIIWTGPVKELDNSGNPYVEQFITGSSSGPITDDRI